MLRRNFLSLALGSTLLAALAAQAVAQPSPAPKKAPDVVGDWSGTWGPYTPTAPGEAQKPNPYAGVAAKLECKVIRKDGKWQATFTGEAGRPYKYTITMQGRQQGGAVLFQGTADLGPKDGGVYDWIGRATETEFVGFYTSESHTGAFRLARPK